MTDWERKAAKKLVNRFKRKPACTNKEKEEKITAALRCSKAHGMFMILNYFVAEFGVSERFRLFAEEMSKTALKHESGEIYHE